MAALFPSWRWWALFLNTLPSTLFLFAPTTRQHPPPPRKLPQAWQQRGAIRVTLSPVSIPINKRWNWIPTGIIKGPTPVLLITSNKAVQVTGWAPGTLAGDNKSLHTLSVREPHSDVLAKHWADVLTKTFPSCPLMMWGFPCISK